MKPTRDQARAAHAYDIVGKLPRDDVKNFKIVVNSFGATVLKGGLCAAVAWAQRYHDAAARDRLLEALGAAGIAGVGRVSAAELPRTIRTLAAEDYMLATRDALAAIVWLRRAVQAAG
jgi:CRISPR-associated protein Cmr5